FVSVDGSGQLIRAVNTGANTYTWPVGDNSGTSPNNTGADYSPVTLAFTAQSTARNIGVNVVDAQEPNDGTSNNYISRYLNFIDDNAGTGSYTYVITLQYSPAAPTTQDLIGTASALYVNGWSIANSAWAQYTPTTTGANTIISPSIVDATASSIGG